MTFMWKGERVIFFHHANFKRVRWVNSRFVSYFEMSVASLLYFWRDRIVVDVPSIQSKHNKRRNRQFKLPYTQTNYSIKNTIQNNKKQSKKQSGAKQKKTKKKHKKKHKNKKKQKTTKNQTNKQTKPTKIAKILQNKAKQNKLNK